MMIRESDVRGTFRLSRFLPKRMKLRHLLATLVSFGLLLFFLLIIRQDKLLKDLQETFKNAPKMAFSTAELTEEELELDLLAMDVYAVKVDRRPKKRSPIPNTTSIQSKKVDSSVQSQGVDSSIQSQEVESSIQSHRVDSSIQSHRVDSSIQSQGVESSVQSQEVDSSIQSQNKVVKPRKHYNKGTLKLRDSSFDVGRTSMEPEEVEEISSSSYLFTPGDPEIAEYRNRVDEYVRSAHFKERVRNFSSLPKRGILVNAGRAKFTTDLIITLKVLREVMNCTLPVQVAWQGQHEMDDETLQALKKHFDPVIGIDLFATPHPEHGVHRSGIDLSGWTGKVYSLIHAPFQEVLMIDADSMPVQHPDVLFDMQRFKDTGNLFWPDAWTNQVKSEAYEMFGVNFGTAMGILNKGKIFGAHDCESGQILIDKRRHADVLEYLFFINSYAHITHPSLMWGDKDSFPLAFAVAGKAHLYAQNAVPPGGLFAWRPNMLLHKRSGKREAGWQLLGFLQHDTAGGPAFMHRTINKFTLTEEPWKLELISSPMPRRWAEYYIHHNSKGPTKGVPWDYVAPNSAFLPFSPSKTLSHASSDRQNECPVHVFQEYWTIREHSLPLDSIPWLDATCEDLLQDSLGDEEFNVYKSRGWVGQPGLKYNTHMVLEEVYGDGFGVENAAPIGGYKADYLQSELHGVFADAIRGAYAAFEWLKENRDDFPVLQQSQ